MKEKQANVKIIKRKKMDFYSFATFSSFVHSQIS